MNIWERIWKKTPKIRSLILHNMKYVLFLSENSLSYLREMTTRQHLLSLGSQYASRTAILQNLGFFLILVQASQWTFFFLCLLKKYATNVLNMR